MAYDPDAQVAGIFDGVGSAGAASDLPGVSDSEPAAAQSNEGTSPTTNSTASAPSESAASPSSETDLHNSSIQQLTETLNCANAPPESIATSANTLIIQPSDPHQTIGIGDGAFGDILLDQAALDYLYSRFSTIQVGGPEGANIVQIGGGAGPVILRGDLIISTPQPGGKVHVDSPIIGLDHASLVILGSGHTLDLNADINLPGGDYLPADAVVVHGNRTVQVGGRVEFNTTSVTGDGNAVPDSLTLIAGTTVNITVPVGGGGLNTLSVQAGTGITISAAGDITLTGAAGNPGGTGGELTLRVTGAGNIVLQGDIVADGGAGAAAGNAGGNGGIVSVIAANGSVTVGRISVQGGAGNGNGSAGQGGTVQISAGTTLAQQAGTGIQTNNLKLISGGNITLANAGNNAAVFT